jgi:hypothetical protein
MKGSKDNSIKKTKEDGFSLKKKSFIEAWENSFGNITVACKALKMSRQTFYDWKNEDEVFKQALKDAEPGEIFLDFAESALQNKIRKGDTTAIIFALKTKGKKRGYIERSEHINVEQKLPFEGWTEEELEAQLKKELDGGEDE